LDEVENFVTGYDIRRQVDLISLEDADIMRQKKLKGGE